MTNPLVGLAATAVALFVVLILMTRIVGPYLQSVTDAFTVIGR